MQDKINNNTTDVFSEMIKQKLENHQLPVDLNDWSAIEKRLKPKRKIILWWMWLPIGSVAMLAMLFTIRTFNEPANSNYALKTTIIQSEKELIAPKEFVYKIDSGNITKSKSSFYKSTSQHKNALKSTNNNTKSVLQQVNSGFFDTIATKRNIADKTSLIAVNKESKTLVLAQQNDTTKSKPEKKKTVLDPNPNDLFASVEKKKTGSNWMLAASYGSQGNVDFAGNGLVSAGNLGDMDLSDPNDIYTSTMAPNDFSSQTYHDPLSFGLNVRKRLNKNLSIESGLVYTYLLSSFENTGVQRSDAKLHLHYIGIPLNLITDIWKKSRWEIYLSTGCMAEKGIQSVYVQNQYLGAQTSTTTVKSNINGIQWSVNGGVGVSYKIQRQLGIYFEPKFSRYFDNNQPVSARTEHPVVLGLSAGLRIGL